MKKTLTACFIVSIILASANAMAQNRCDGLADSASIFHVVEQMPKANLDADEIARILNESYEAAPDSKDGESKFVVALIVNCEGQAYNYRSVRSLGDSIDRRLINLIRSNVEWSSGKQRDELVDVQMVLAFDLFDGRLVPTRPKATETKKRKRKKKKGI